MEFGVIKSFQDKHTKVVYKKSSTYQTEDDERADFLIEKGFLKENEARKASGQLNGGTFTLEDVLDQTVAEIEETITADEFTQVDLRSFLDFEKQNKARKGVIEHLESLLTD